MLALAANLVADGAGCWPTIKKTFKHPEGEDKWAWGFWWTGNVINLFAVEDWSFAGSAYPVYMVTASTIITALTFIPKRHTAP